MQSHYDRVTTLEFTRDRKMMSVLVTGEGRTQMWTKV
jgi:magnesium-transporting ATPase (P-type)